MSHYRSKTAKAQKEITLYRAKTNKTIKHEINQKKLQEKKHKKLNQKNL